MPRGDGGCSFAPDPDIRADQTVVFWRPELLADLVRLVPPTGSPFETRLRFDPARWPARCVMHSAEDGIHAIVADPAGEHRLWLPGPEPPLLGTPLAVMLDCDSYMQERANAAMRFWRFAVGLPVSRSPPARQASRVHRLAEMLWAMDLRGAGHSQRDVAAALLGSEPAADWADHSDRSRIRRLLRDATAFASTRYRDFLRPARRLFSAVTR